MLCSKSKSYYPLIKTEHINGDCKVNQKTKQFWLFQNFYYLYLKEGVGMDYMSYQSFKSALPDYPIKPGLPDLPLTFWSLTDASDGSKRTITYFCRNFQTTKGKLSQTYKLLCIHISSSLFYLQVCNHTLFTLFYLQFSNHYFK